MINPTSTAAIPRPSATGPIWALGFRPFFLLAGLAAVLLLGHWETLLNLTDFAPPSYYGPIGWHSHEMLFGFTTAVIAGFLLTAVRNWTGMTTLNGRWLAYLALLWLAARIAPFVPYMPDMFIGFLDLLFLPLLALAIHRPILQAHSRGNYWIAPLLLMMFVANGLVHLNQLVITLNTQGIGIRWMLNSIILLLLIISGRILPFFTERAIPGARPQTDRRLERLCIGGWGLLMFVEIFAQDGLAAGLLSLILAALCGTRLWKWQHRQLWNIPMLWILYLGHGWIIIGLLLKGAAAGGWISPNLAIHALTLGVVGTFTLGMMSRVTLGHTGRPIEADRLTVFSFGLISLAALLRVLAPALAPAHYNLWIAISGLCWVLAFSLFLVVYAPMLWAPRTDGRPG